MIIKADQEGLKVIQRLIDVALKTGGINNLQSANAILNSCELTEEPVKAKEEKE